jgi:hypothetical protein
MSLTPRQLTEGRRLKAFRLSEVPLDLRLAAADLIGSMDENLHTEVELAVSKSFEDRVVIGLVAACPSETVYWISQKAWDTVVGEFEKRQAEAQAIWDEYEAFQAAERRTAA